MTQSRVCCRNLKKSCLACNLQKSRSLLWTEFSFSLDVRGRPCCKRWKNCFSSSSVASSVASSIRSNSISKSSNASENFGLMSL